ncbi:MAG: hypothetical protein QM751_04280 [Paludibacteraceae bacterium]
MKTEEKQQLNYLGISKISFKKEAFLNKSYLPTTPDYKSQRPASFFARLISNPAGRG